MILILQGQHKPTERDALRTWLSWTQECLYVWKHLLLLEDLWLTYAPTSGMPYLQHLGLDGGAGGELTYPNGISPPTWGTNLRNIPLNIPYCVWQEDMGICRTHKEVSKNIQHNKRECVCYLSGFGQSRISTNPLGKKDSHGKSPSFLQHLPQVQGGAHTIDRRITRSHF